MSLWRTTQRRKENLPLRGEVVAPMIPSKSRRSTSGVSRFCCVVAILVVWVVGKSISNDSETDWQSLRSLGWLSAMWSTATTATKEPHCQNFTTVVEKVVERKVSTASMPTEQTCRDVFGTKGQGGVEGLTTGEVKKFCQDPLTFDVCSDLAAFTGLSATELSTRLERTGRFHFEGEHAFWNPQSSSELAWYYSTSVDYLFANSAHPAHKEMLAHVVQHKLEPVLDYSGGVGNTVLYLAQTHGLSVQYFGIGMMERAFAEFRIRRRGLTDKVSFQLPYSAATNWTFDPVKAPLPRDKSLGAILAMDVLEHIPNYHLVVEAMVESIRVGGVIVEVTPFGTTDSPEAVHLSNGGISMKEAMGPRMKDLLEGKKAGAGVWIKLAKES